MPSEAAAPFRLAQLDWGIAADNSFSYRHEIDRGLVALHPEWGDVTIGRQAVGLGQEVLFGTVDVFNPFSPLEVDREWRRGVDAFRAEYRLSATSSAECIGAFGETWEQSALLGEYHYSDFGVEDAEDTLIRLQDPDFQERLMNIITFFAPYTQPSLIEQPTKRCFHHVAKLPEGAAIDRIAFGDQRRGLTLTQRLTNLILDVIGAIRQHFVRTSAGTSVWLWWNMESDTLP